MASLAVVEKVRTHLSEVASDGSKALDQELLNKIDAQVIGMDNRCKLVLRVDTLGQIAFPKPRKMP
jgi:hypothetical protein